MAITIKCTKKQYEELVTMALFSEYDCICRIEKAQRRSINPKLFEKARQRAVSNIEFLAERRKKYQDLYELLRNNRQWAHKETIHQLEKLEKEAASLCHILEMMTEHGLAPEQYLSSLEIGLRLSKKFRQN